MSHVPPQNIEAEESVLGAMLVAEPALTRVIDEVKLNAEDFYLDKHATIFRAIHDLYAVSKPVDELSVTEALVQRNQIEEAGGKHHVSELAAKVPAAGNAKHYAEIVQQNSLHRQRIAIGHELASGDLSPEEAAERLRALSAGAPAGRDLQALAYSEVEPEAVRWAWQGRIPLGAVTVLAGRQGLGKSTLLAEIAAGLSTGRLEGDLHGAPSAVLTASFEDPAAQVAARLRAAGANTVNVLEIAATRDGTPDLLSLPADIDLLRPLIERHRPRALFVDPLMAALSGGVDSHRDQDVRRVLAPLAQLAEESDLAIVAVLHLRKGAASEALDRVSGSVAFTAAARSVMVFGARDDGDDDEQDAGGRVLAHGKCNVGPLVPSLAYRIEGTTIEHGGRQVETSRLAYEGEIDVQAGELLAPPVTEDRTEIEVAADWLADYLGDGEWHLAAEVRDAARVADIAARTLQRAASRVGVEKDRFAPEGVGGRGSAKGHWRLPIAAPAVPAPVGATMDGATIKPHQNAEYGGAGSLSRQGAHAGATTTQTVPATPDEEAEVERIAAEIGVEP